MKEKRLNFQRDDKRKKKEEEQDEKKGFNERAFGGTKKK